VEIKLWRFQSWMERTQNRSFKARIDVPTPLCTWLAAQQNVDSIIDIQKNLFNRWFEAMIRFELFIHSIISFNVRSNPLQLNRWMTKSPKKIRRWKCWPITQIEEYPDEPWNKVLNLNVKSVSHLTVGFLLPEKSCKKGQDMSNMAMHLASLPWFDKI